MMRLPLEGIRILDLSRQMSGPYGTMMLSDYGADIIKIEGLPGGDPSRITGTDFTAGESWLYLVWNRGKRSVAVDLHQKEGIELVHRLARTADVVVENYRPGVAEQIGVGYESLSAGNPRLVYCSVSAFGQEGPLSGFPGMDVVVQAMSGIMSVTGEPDGPPELVGVPVGDYVGALACVQAVLLGLLARQQTGHGQKVDVSMLHGLLWALGTRLGSFWARGTDPQRYGHVHSVVVPYQEFETADGYVVAGVFGDEGDGWQRFCQAMDDPQMALDPRYTTNIDRVAHRSELTSELGALFRKRTSAEWEERFHARRVLFGQVCSFSQIFSHPQVGASGSVQSVEHPLVGSMPQLAPLVGLSETPGRIRGPAPLLGQHTAEVLREAGFSEAEIERLKASQVISTSGDDVLRAQSAPELQAASA